MRNTLRNWCSRIHLWTPTNALAASVVFVLGMVAMPSARAQTLVVLHSFTGADGANPYAGLIRDAEGNLYGTTTAGGAYGYGVVFKVDTSGNETVLHSFTGGVDGADPYPGLIEDAAGNLYGTTKLGGAGGTRGPAAGLARVDAAVVGAADPPGPGAPAPLAAAAGRGRSVPVVPPNPCRATRANATATAARTPSAATPCRQVRRRGLAGGAAAGPDGGGGGTGVPLPASAAGLILTVASESSLSGIAGHHAAPTPRRTGRVIGAAR